MWHHQATEAIQHMIVRYRMTPTAQARLAINTSWQEVKREMDTLIKELEIKHKEEEKDALAYNEGRREIFRSDKFHR